jgi:hypothetical protein
VQTKARDKDLFGATASLLEHLFDHPTRRFHRVVTQNRVSTRALKR